MTRSFMRLVTLAFLGTGLVPLVTAAGTELMVRRLSVESGLKS